ncbi:hypothetical protein BY996DRAFT_2233159 [Phakopsora pachyrhizi]|nr:hypothetical protein BY996DRAFT_2233159 [Phakopsora pachyrhizi]
MSSLANRRVEQPHSSAKRIRSTRTGNIYSQLLPINLSEPISFLSTLIPILRPSKQQTLKLRGAYEPISNSVWIEDASTMFFLWQRGFFGKGSLSRSEPTWLHRARNRRLVEILEDDSQLRLTAEELTAKRRIERRDQKIQKLKLKKVTINDSEKEKTNQTSGEKSPDSNEKLDLQDESRITNVQEVVEIDQNTAKTARITSEITTKPLKNVKNKSLVLTEEVRDEVQAIKNLEHLQLMNEEAFFLTFGLGSLDVFSEEEDQTRVLSILEMWELFCRSSVRASRDASSMKDERIRSDNPFIISYVAYHHFRSLGWVVRSGVKFCSDWVLYGSKGPVGGHAEFAICVIPIYEDGRLVKTLSDERRSWRWLNTVNRVCAGVKKTLVLAYVVVPIDDGREEFRSPKKVLSRYSVKEVLIKRFIPTRMRD